MTKLLFALGITFTLFSCASLKNSGEKITGEYDVSCGMCNFDMTGDDCDLAIEIDGKFYYVEESSLEEHGDAHAEDGLCTVVRKAKVTGEIKHGVFVAEELELLPYSN